MSVEQKTNIILDCKACGKISNVNPKLRLCSFILKRPPAPKEQKGADATVSQQFGALTIEDLEFASEWTESETNGFETSEAPLDPVDALSRFLLAKKKPTTDEIQDRVKAMALQYGWKKQAIVAAVFGALFGKDMVNRVADHAETLSLFVQGDSDQLRVLSLFEKLCSIDATAASKVSFILQELYDHDVLDEDNIVKWSTTLPKAGDLQSAKALRERASKFVAWLCADDSADSAEEEQK
jgi:translation initiation factor 5